MGIVETPFVAGIFAGLLGFAALIGLAVAVAFIVNRFTGFLDRP